MGSILLSDGSILDPRYGICNNRGDPINGRGGGGAGGAGSAHLRCYLSSGFISGS